MNQQICLASLIISIIILIIVIILIIIVCVNYNNSNQSQPILKNPGLAAAVAYKYKNNFCGWGGTSKCDCKEDGTPCSGEGGYGSTCMGGLCMRSGV